MATAWAAEAVGPMPDGKLTHLALNDTSEQVFFPAVELAVSVEPLGAQPRVPSLPFVYRGLCEKLWR